MTNCENINPYDDNRPKTEQVREMFDSIAPAYDFMNRAMTFGIDKLSLLQFIGNVWMTPANIGMVYAKC